MMDFTALPLPGAPLAEGEVWVYYDGLRSFTVESRHEDLVYVINSVEEDDDTSIFLAAPQTRERLRMISQGGVEFRDAFTETVNGALYVITWHWQETTRDWSPEVREISVLDVTETWLPLPEAWLGQRRK